MQDLLNSFGDAMFFLGQCWDFFSVVALLHDFIFAFHDFLLVTAHPSPDIRWSAPNFFPLSILSTVGVVCCAISRPDLTRNVILAIFP